MVAETIPVSVTAVITYVKSEKKKNESPYTSTSRATIQYFCNRWSGQVIKNGGMISLVTWLLPALQNNLTVEAYLFSVALWWGRWMWLCCVSVGSRSWWGHSASALRPVWRSESSPSWSRSPQSQSPRLAPQPWLELKGKGNIFISFIIGWNFLWM